MLSGTPQLVLRITGLDLDLNGSLLLVAGKWEPLDFFAQAVLGCFGGCSFSMLDVFLFNFKHLHVLSGGGCRFGLPLIPKRGAKEKTHPLSFQHNLQLLLKC